MKRNQSTDNSARQRLLERGNVRPSGDEAFQYQTKPAKVRQSRPPKVSKQAKILAGWR